MLSDSNISGTEITGRCSTRSTLPNATADLSIQVSKSCQTETFDAAEACPFPQVPTRIRPRHTSSKAKLLNPTIIETAVECETVARCSMDTAIKVIQMWQIAFLGRIGHFHFL